MTDRILAVVVLLVLAGFLGILLWHVPRTDLSILVALTLLLAARDVVWPERKG